MKPNRLTGCKILGVQLLMLTLMLMAGCKGPKNTGIGNLALAAQQQMDCCANKLEISFFDSSTAGDYYCQIGVKHGGQLLGLGPLHMLHCQASTMQCDITVDYSMIHASGNYDFYVYVYSDSYDCGDIKKAHHTSSALSVYISTSDWDTANCHISCCTGGRKYAQIQKVKEDVVAIKANIATRYGRLCNSVGIIRNAFSVAYINIFMHDGNEWAQMGYGMERDSAFGDAIFPFKYCEVKGAEITPTAWYDRVDYPQPSQYHIYASELDPTDGTWLFKYDGVIFRSIPDEFWINKFGEAIGWSAEILNFEDDMVGTTYEKCEFTTCGYKTVNDQNYLNPYFQDYEPYSDEPLEWIIMRTGDNSILIYDNNPQP
ncbi:MAG: hypothetical protein NT002_03255 [candidate division Zixibacteria bacterium]|nr:hypothetical protein [candidate division Zixibacteria bacterium]